MPFQGGVVGEAVSFASNLDFDYDLTIYRRETAAFWRELDLGFIPADAIFVSRIHWEGWVALADPPPALRAATWESN
jgi:hypothetical protein